MRLTIKQQNYRALLAMAGICVSSLTYGVTIEEYKESALEKQWITLLNNRLNGDGSLQNYRYNGQTENFLQREQALKYEVYSQSLNMLFHKNIDERERNGLAHAVIRNVFRKLTPWRQILVLKAYEKDKNAIIYAPRTFNEVLNYPKTRDISDTITEIFDRTCFGTYDEINKILDLFALINNDNKKVEIIKELSNTCKAAMKQSLKVSLLKEEVSMFNDPAFPKLDFINYWLYNCMPYHLSYNDLKSVFVGIFKMTERPTQEIDQVAQKFASGSASVVRPQNVVAYSDRVYGRPAPSFSSIKIQTLLNRLPQDRYMMVEFLKQVLCNDANHEVFSFLYTVTCCHVGTASFAKAINMDSNKLKNTFNNYVINVNKPTYGAVSEAEYRAYMKHYDRYIVDFLENDIK